MFQSHNGAIAARSVIYDDKRQNGFNPTMVRLLREAALEAFKTNLSFNPTMVRLLREFCHSLRRVLSEFQSHNGAIAAKIISEVSKIPRVSIPQWCDCCWSNRWRMGVLRRSFNPTMVRLLLLRIKDWVEVRRKFQSHNGAIAATNDAVNVTISAVFQSHNGAIAASSVRLARISTCLVSIPQWCDCCSFITSAYSITRQVSIPQW